MAALLSDEELATITLKSSFVYEYGDMPYFRRCLNEFPLQFFARYRANKDDPSQHRWSRILEVVHRQSGSSNNNGDVAAASATAAPLKWKEKQFLIALRVEGEDKCVELPRLSSKLPAAEEVMAYCARRAEQQLHTANGNAEVLGADARSQLPSAQEIQKMKVFRHGVIVNHQWTPEEVAAAREQNERIGRVGAGSAPVRLTVTSLHNMRLETELGIASSRHMTGPTAMALERRSGSDLALHSGRRAESPA
ncbi:hypothetical protein DQ04_18581000, partial [Trypanosoma grayi]|uniref:hypothetical protein n=1 Tax=Trypanosoma grayi TaxID=71804 RepID=UPI0004F47A37